MRQQTITKEREEVPYEKLTTSEVVFHDKP